MAGAKMINLPNAITFFRLCLAAPFAYLLLKEENTYAILVFAMFLALDFLDGFAARRLMQETRFGKRFDYITDGVFAAIIFFVQVFKGKVHPVIWSLALSNYLVVGVIMLFMKKNMYNEKKRIGRRELGILSYYTFLFILLVDIYNQIVFSIVTMLLASMYYSAYRYYADY